MLKHAWVFGLLFISSLAEARWYQPEHAELGKPLYEKLGDHRVATTLLA